MKRIQLKETELDDASAYKFTNLREIASALNEAYLTANYYCNKNNKKASNLCKVLGMMSEALMKICDFDTGDLIY